MTHQGARISYTTGPDAFAPGTRLRARGCTVTLMSPVSLKSIAASAAEVSDAKTAVICDVRPIDAADMIVAGAEKACAVSVVQDPASVEARPVAAIVAPVREIVSSGIRAATLHVIPMSGHAARKRLQPATPLTRDRLTAELLAERSPLRSVPGPISFILALKLIDSSDPKTSVRHVIRSPVGSMTPPTHAVPLAGLMLDIPSEPAITLAGSVITSAITKAAKPSMAIHIAERRKITSETGDASDPS